MTSPILTLEDEFYVQLRVAGRSPAIAAMFSRDCRRPWDSPRVASICEASPFIHARYRELGRPDLVRADHQ